MRVECPTCHFDNNDQSNFCSKCGSALRDSEDGSFTRTKTFLKKSQLLPAGSLFAGKYQITELLGKGGMGIVYKAEDLKLKRTVALKLIIPEALESEKRKARFVVEAQAAAALNHPNICTIYDIEEGEGMPFIILEYIEGQSLKRIIEEKPHDIDDSIELAMQIADGLQEAHEKGIVHRDIKSGNIMITHKGQAKITDFGLAKLLDDSVITRTATVMGTVPYMSPEQASGDNVDHRTDIWSLGVVIFEMLTGRFPFKGESEQAILHSIIYDEPRAVTGIRSGIPLEFERILDKCLEKDVSQRYQSVADLKADLKRLKRDITTGKVESATKTIVSSPSPPKASPKLLLPLAGLLLVLLIFMSVPALRQLVFDLFLPGVRPGEGGVLILPSNVVADNPAERAFCKGVVESISGKISHLERSHKKLWILPGDLVRELDVDSVSKAHSASGVSHVITCDIHRSRDTVSLFFNLYDAKTQRRLNPTLDIKDSIANIGTFQMNAVEKLALLLGIKLSPRDRQFISAGDTTIPGAYESYQQGLGYMIDSANGDLDKAIQLFDMATEQDPSYGMAYACLGKVYWEKFLLTKEQGLDEKARSFCEEALDIDSHLVSARILLGIIDRVSDKYDKALEEFKQALEVDPLNFNAQLELAKTYEGMNRTDEAEEAYKKAAYLNTGRYLGFTYLGVFYSTLGRWDEAEREWLKVIKLAPSYVTCYNNLGALYWYLDQFERAEEMFVKSINIEPSADGYSNLGFVYYRQNNYLKALEMFEKAVAEGDRYYMLYGNLADTYRFVAGEKERAEEMYRRAIQLAEGELQSNPRNAEICGWLGRFYALVNEREKALQRISEAKRIAPENPVVLRLCVYVYEFIDQRDQALLALQELIERGESMEDFQKDPDLADMRRDPRFKQLTGEN
jgi:serine/threonine protein kinase/tetratricopeptide (TPR) repeat protein